jgi:hypothetical protein
VNGIWRFTMSATLGWRLRFKASSKMKTRSGDENIARSARD